MIEWINKIQILQKYYLFISLGGINKYSHLHGQNSELLWPIYCQSASAPSTVLCLQRHAALATVQYTSSSFLYSQMTDAHLLIKLVIQ